MFNTQTTNDTKFGCVLKKLIEQKYYDWTEQKNGWLNGKMCDMWYDDDNVKNHTIFFSISLNFTLHFLVATIMIVKHKIDSNTYIIINMPDNFFFWNNLKKERLIILAIHRHWIFPV